MWYNTKLSSRLRLKQYNFQYLFEGIKSNLKCKRRHQHSNGNINHFQSSFMIKKNLNKQNIQFFFWCGWEKLGFLAYKRRLLTFNSVIIFTNGACFIDLRKSICFLSSRLHCPSVFNITIKISSYIRRTCKNHSNQT